MYIYWSTIATISPPLYLAKAFSMPFQSLISWIFWQFSTLELPGCVHERTVTQAMNTYKKKPASHTTPLRNEPFSCFVCFSWAKTPLIHTLSIPPLPKQKKNTLTHKNPSSPLHQTTFKFASPNWCGNNPRSQFRDPTQPNQTSPNRSSNKNHKNPSCKKKTPTFNPTKPNLAAHRQGYRVISLHIGNGWATL